MSVIVSSGRSCLRCDECGARSEYVDGDHDGQRDIRRVMQNRGWQCCTNGKDYCPKHAYGRSIESSENTHP